MKSTMASPSIKNPPPPSCSGKTAPPAATAKGRIWATYLHGMLDGDQFRRAFINMVRKDSGLKANPALHTAYDLDGALDRLADVVRKHLDLKTIYRALQLKR